jgi:hypothetical protein
MSDTFLPQKFVEISGSKETGNKKSKMKMTTSGRIGTWVKARLYYGENRSKLVGFKEKKKCFAFLKAPSLDPFLQKCKHHLIKNFLMLLMLFINLEFFFILTKIDRTGKEIIQ